MKLREWVTIVLVIGFMASISLIAHYSEDEAHSALNKAPSAQMVTVSLTGAVKKSGAYSCKPGTTLNELLKKVGLDAAADRKLIPTKKVFYTSQSMEIPRKIEGKKISLEEK